MIGYLVTRFLRREGRIMIKQYYIVIVACLFIISNSVTYAKVEATLGDVKIEENQNLPGFVPQTSTTEILLSRNQYVISYDRIRRSPIWVAWKIEAQNLGSSGRSNNFNQDSELETYLSQVSPTFHAVNFDEYHGSCFDRGHQIPSGDRTDRPENNEKTFLMSNMIPQTAYLNRGAWAHLEGYARDLVKQQNKKIFVIAGPIYDQDFGLIGPNKDIPVPSKNFKIIFILDQNQNASDINKATPTISVVMPNLLKNGDRPMDNPDQLCNPTHNIVETDPNDWEKFKTTTQEIEKISGITLPYIH